MGRLIELTVFAVFLWLALESWVARLSGRGGRGSRSDPRRTPAARPRPQTTAAPRSADLTLVRCAACGTHVPESRTVARGGARYCSERCARGTAGVEKAEAGTARAGERAG